MNLPDCLRCHPMDCVLPRRFPFQNSARSEQRPLRTATVVGNESRPRAKNAGHEQPDGPFPRVTPTPIRSPQRLHMEYCTWNTAHGTMFNKPKTQNPKTQNPRSRKICFPSVCQLGKAHEFLNGHWITTFTEHHFIRSGNTPFGVRSLKK